MTIRRCSKIQKFYTFIKKNIRQNIFITDTISNKNNNKSFVNFKNYVLVIFETKHPNYKVMAFKIMISNSTEKYTMLLSIVKFQIQNNLLILREYTVFKQITAFYS